MTHSLTKNDILRVLDSADLHPKDRGRYALTRCPQHEDRNPSCQVFYDGWIKCHAGCESIHVTKIFPELKDDYTKPMKPIKVEKRPPKVNYKKQNMYDKWQQMPMIPRDHTFKSIPLEVLDDLGWRYDNGSYFIPYWNATRTQIPFGQWRHLVGDRRFTFLKDAEPIAYGLWNVYDGETLFVVEGTSDAATMQYCGLPWIAMPSASSSKILERFSDFAEKNNIRVVFACDNDDAGNSLKKHIRTSFRTVQPPGYKDWSDFLDATSIEEVQYYALQRL